jgi:energy-coupling factor transporter ATP-binding protein EcfA2
MSARRITTLEILDPYFPEIIFQTGDKIPLDGKNLLLIGGNGAGKTTFLHMIQESFKHRDGFEEGTSLSVKDRPYHGFISNYVSKAEMVAEELPLDIEPASDRERFEFACSHFAPALHNSLEQGTQMYFDPRLKVPRKVLEATLNASITAFMEEFPDDVYADSEDGRALRNPKNPTVLGAALLSCVNVYIRAAETYAKELKIPKPVLYGTLHLLERELIGQFESDMARWRFVKPSGAVPGSCVSSYKPPEETVFVESLSLPLPKTHDDQLYLLDEPTDNLGRKQKLPFTEGLADYSDNQVIVATHDPTLLRLATDHPNWNIYDLDTKELFEP